MGAAMTKAECLERLEQARTTWEEIVAAAGDAGMDRPGAAGDWTLKDVAAHLNGWRTETVDRLEAAARDEPPPPQPWPADLRGDTEAINRWLYERNRDRPADEILAEAREQYRRMRAAIEAIPEADLTAPDRYPRLEGKPLTAVVADSADHLHEEHEPALRAWLVERPG